VEWFVAHQRTVSVAESLRGSLQGGGEWATAFEQVQQPRAPCTSVFALLTYTQKAVFLFRAGCKRHCTFKAI